MRIPATRVRAPHADAGPARKRSAVRRPPPPPSAVCV
eukprot:gene1454-14147_t